MNAIQEEPPRCGSGNTRLPAVGPMAGILVSLSQTSVLSIRTRSIEVGRRDGGGMPVAVRVPDPDVGARHRAVTGPWIDVARPVESKMLRGSGEQRAAPSGGDAQRQHRWRASRAKSSGVCGPRCRRGACSGGARHPWRFVSSYSGSVNCHETISVIRRRLT